jgi:hypothetical protein
MQAGFKGVIDWIKAFSETDFTEGLKNSSANRQTQPGECG